MNAADNTLAAARAAAIHRILLTVSSIESFEKYQVGHVFIAVPMNRYHEARHVFDALSQTLVEVRIVADVSNLAGLSLTTTNLDGLPVIGLRESPIGKVVDQVAAAELLQHWLDRRGH